jgi:hypothetical protein
MRRWISSQMRFLQLEAGRGTCTRETDRMLYLISGFTANLHAEHGGAVFREQGSAKSEAECAEAEEKRRQLSVLQERVYRFIRDVPARGDESRRKPAPT